MACRLSSCGSQALECRLSSCGARAFLLCGMWDLPGPGLEPMSPALAGGFLTTAPPGKPKKSVLFLTPGFIPSFLCSQPLPHFQSHKNLHHQESCSWLLIYLFITGLIFLLCILHIYAGIVLPKYEPDKSKSPS